MSNVQYDVINKISFITVNLTLDFKQILYDIKKTSKENLAEIELNTFPSKLLSKCMQLAIAMSLRVN